MRNRSEMKKQYVNGILTVMIWATMATVAKSALAELPNMEVLAAGSLFAFLFLFCVNVSTGRIRDMKNYRGGQILAMAGLGFLGLFLYSALYYQGLVWLSAQEACILNYLWPIMLVLFSTVILRERMTAGKAAAMLCSFAGIVLLSLGGSGEGEEHRAAGIVCCVTAAAAYGLFSVLNKKADYDQNLTMMVIWLTTAVCAAVCGRLTETWVPVSGGRWIAILWLGVVVNAIAYLMWALALRGTANTASIANLAYLTPFLSVLISAVFLHEKLGLRAAAALVLIVGGILIQSYFAERETTEDDRDAMD